MLRRWQLAAAAAGAAAGSAAAGVTQLQSTRQPSALVTDWTDRQKAARLEQSYQASEVVQQRAAMMAMLRPAPGERILDVGCGPGFLLHQIAAAVGSTGDAEGVDSSEAMCELARARLSGIPTGPAVRVGCATALPYPSDSFDAVVLSQVLLYVEDVPLALAEARRVLRSGGRLLVCETDWDSLVVATDDHERFERLRAACCSTFVDAHLPPKLPGLLARAGLALCDCTVPMIGAGVPERGGGSFVGNWAFRVVAEKAAAYGCAHADVSGWLEEQARRADERAFFACVHRFLFLARKPADD